jgi:phage/plasmid-like protein (TIGR03299 family)
MSHELDKDQDGNARLMYNRETGVPWHGLGTPVSGLATAEEAIVAAGLDTVVTLEPVYQLLLDGKHRQVPESFLVVRDVDEKVLGKVSKRYVPIQNRQAFDFCDALVDSDEAKYDTAGALRGGKEIFISAKLPKGTQILGDELMGHLLLSTAHTGLRALTARYVVTRVVCANTLSCAFGEAVPVWSFPHVTGIEEQVEQAREALQLVTAYDAEFAKIAERLAETRLVLTQADKVLGDALPDRMRSAENVGAVMANLANSSTIKDEHRRTMWGLFNAFTEWSEHQRPVRSVEGRFHSVIDGDVSRTRDRLVRRMLVKA